MYICGVIISNLCGVMSLFLMGSGLSAVSGSQKCVILIKSFGNSVKFFSSSLGYCTTQQH